MYNALLMHLRLRIEHRLKLRDHDLVLQLMIVHRVVEVHEVVALFVVRVDAPVVDHERARCHLAVLFTVVFCRIFFNGYLNCWLIGPLGRIYLVFSVRIEVSIVRHVSFNFQPLMLWCIQEKAFEVIVPVSAIKRHIWDGFYVDS